MPLDVQKADPNWTKVRDHVVARARDALDVLTTPGLSEEQTAIARGAVNEAVELLEAVYGDGNVILTVTVVEK